MAYTTHPLVHAGGGVVTQELSGLPDQAFVQINFSGRATGVITVTAKAVGGDTFESVTDGAIDLATKRTLLINGFSLKELRFSDAGSGAVNITIIQRT